jgi:hypothetical protein
LEQSSQFSKSKKGDVLMLSFKEFIEEVKTKKREKTNGRKYTHQGSSESGHVDQQGQANRPHQEVQPNNVHVFPEPQ